MKGGFAGPALTEIGIKSDPGADLLGPPSFLLRGSKADPSPQGVQAEDLVFLRDHSGPTFRGSLTSPDVNGPLDFSPSGHAFSGPQASSNSEAGTALVCDPPPRGNWPPRVPRSSSFPAVCSEGGIAGAWLISARSVIA